MGSPRPNSKSGAACSRLLSFGLIAIIVSFWHVALGQPAKATDAFPHDLAALLALTDRFEIPEEGEDKPGGEATSRKSSDNANAYSHSSGNLDFKKEFDFKIGNAIFRKLWVSSPASTKSSDGLGPLYNARACQSCHLKDGRGHPPRAGDIEDNAISLLIRLSVPPANDTERQLLKDGHMKVLPEPVYGGQLQPFSVQGHQGEGRVILTYSEADKITLPGGETVTLQKPEFRITDLAYGPMHPDTMISPRIAPQMIGLGLLELIPETQILRHADPDDKDGDGISGRPQMVWSDEYWRMMLGRFGHKAGAPTVSQQVADAFAGDIGISSPLIHQPYGDCTEAQSFCRNAPNGEDGKSGAPEIDTKLFKLVNFYSRNLAVPARRDAGNKDILKGKELFYATGCTACHRPKFVTGMSADQPHLSNQLIWPYTDMLLHDMGEGLADNRPEARANGREWRTAPLWGIGLTETVNGHTLYLHDGRARNLLEAILWHGGEAEAAREAFKTLSKEDRDRLIAFVKSL